MILIFSGLIHEVYGLSKNFDIQTCVSCSRKIFSLSVAGETVLTRIYIYIIAKLTRCQCQSKFRYVFVSEFDAIKHSRLIQSTLFFLRKSETFKVMHVQHDSRSQHS